MGDEQRKVAVLGGGCGAMATAFALSATPELRDRFDITVYTPGWRLGGKGASGRNQAVGDRIEEHGLHVWFGFYLEAFRMLEAAYDELDRPPGTPAATAATAFTPVDGVVVYDDYDGAWTACDVSLPFRLPPGGGELPRMDGSVDDTGFPTHLTVAQVATRWVDELWTWLRGELPDHGDALAAIERDLERVAIPERLERALDGHPGPAPTNRLGLLHRIIERGEAWVLDHITGLVRVVRDLLLDLLEPLLHVRQVRLVWTTLDVAMTAVIGIGADRLYDRGFSSIDHLDFLTWLRSHGARPLTIGTNAADRAPALRAMYDTSFAFAGGDLDQPDGAAGVALATAIRMVIGYQGHFLYRMNGGMGDIVFTPLYQALHQRGVRFEFFRSVTDIRLDADAAAGIGGDSPSADTAMDRPLGTIEEFDVVHQVQLTGDGYQPLVEVKDLMCWPNEPLWDQLADGTELAERGVDFEREANPLGVRPVTMRRGEDFDFVVMAIPPAASQPLCRAFADAEPWRSFYATTETVATQAFQLWFDRVPPTSATSTTPTTSSARSSNPSTPSSRCSNSSTGRTGRRLRRWPVSPMSAACCPMATRTSRPTPTTWPSAAHVGSSPSRSPHSCPMCDTRTSLHGMSSPPSTTSMEHPASTPSTGGATRHRASGTRSRSQGASPIASPPGARASQTSRSRAIGSPTRSARVASRPW